MKPVPVKPTPVAAKPVAVPQAPVAAPVATPVAKAVPQVTIPKVHIPAPSPKPSILPKQEALKVVPDDYDDVIETIAANEELEQSFNRKDRRRMNRAGKPKKSDESLVQKIEAAFLVALAKKYPENKDIIFERDRRVQPKKVKGAKEAKSATK